MKPLLEHICPAGSLPALKAAVDNGVDGVYLGLSVKNMLDAVELESVTAAMPLGLGGLVLRLRQLAMGYAG